MILRKRTLVKQNYLSRSRRSWSFGQEGGKSQQQKSKWGLLWRNCNKTNTWICHFRNGRRDLRSLGEDELRVRPTRYKSSEQAEREARILLRWPELGWRKTQGRSPGAWTAERNQASSVHRAGTHVCLLRVCPKVQKLTAEVEGRHAKPGAVRSLLASLPRSSQPVAEPLEKRRDTESAEGRARCVLAPASPPSKLPPRPRPRVCNADGAQAGGGAHADPSPPQGAPSLRYAPLLPSPPPRRAAPHGLRAAEALPSAWTSPRSLGRVPTCQARPPAVSPAVRCLLQTPTHCANTVATAAPAGTETSLQTPTPGLLPRKHFPLPLVLSVHLLYPLPG